MTIPKAFIGNFFFPLSDLFISPKFKHIINGL